MSRIRAPAADGSKRVPFPGFKPRSSSAASYTLTREGHVYRSDGLLVIPSERPVGSGGARGPLIVKLGGGHATRSMARAMWDAFGNKRRMPVSDQDWIPWLCPNAPPDPLTRVRQCSVHYVYLVRRGDAQRYAMTGVLPQDRIQII